MPVIVAQRTLTALDPNALAALLPRGVIKMGAYGVLRGLKPRPPTSVPSRRRFLWRLPLRRFAITTTSFEAGQQDDKACFPLCADARFVDVVS